MNRRFWSGKRAFVTGHTGFKGSWLCAWLLEAGAAVSGYALAARPENALFDDAGLARDMTSTIADIRHRSALENAMRASAPDIVVHLAAQSLVRESYERPVETFDINVIGTANVLQAARAASSVRAIVVVTSDKCYKTGAPERRHAEDDPLGGDDPYSASKAGAEFIAASYRESFFEGRTVATARAGNVIGGGDFARDRLLPDLLRAFDDGRPAQLRRPDAVRPWQHVLDPLAGYARLAEMLYDDPQRFAGPWNFGPPSDHEVPVSALADLAVRAWGKPAQWLPAGGEHPPESAALRLDSAKSGHQLGWCGRVPLSEAVEWTVQWHRARTSGENARDLVRGDIERFEKVAT
jgi:CDP-glucose 4,6-dehydratase